MVDFGDKTIDLSVSSRVNRLNSVLQRELLSLLWSLLSLSQSALTEGV